MAKGLQRSDGLSLWEVVDKKVEAMFQLEIIMESNSSLQCQALLAPNLN